MKEIELDAYPGVVALFLPECGHLKNKQSPTTEEVKQSSYISVAAPFGCNHRNVNISAIECTSSYGYSLKDLYSKKEFRDLDERSITSITDSLVTPLVVVPFSIEKVPDVLVQSSDSVMLLDVVENVTLSHYQTVAPKIETDTPNMVTLRSSFKGKEATPHTAEKGTYRQR
jgi:hypothetical protein